MQKLKLRREIRGASCSERLSLSVLSEKQNIIKREVKTCAFYFPLFAFSNFCDWIFYYAPSTDKRLVNGGDGLVGIVAVDKDGDKINAVITESKSGRRAIKAASVVDATGDCDIALFANAPTDTFKQGNILAAWYYFLDNSGYNLNPLGCADIPDDQKNGKNGVETLINRRFTGLDADELSQMVELSHGAVLEDIKKKRLKGSDLVPTSIATIPQIRMTRKLVGEYVLHDTEEHKYFEDSVGLVSDWRKRGPVYEVPFRTLYSAEIKNLITAGRCTSVTDSMWDIMRVIPCCAVTGQAAGTAAALTDDFTALDIKKLQERLSCGGVVLHENQL